MKKTFALFAAVMMLCTMSNAQPKSVGDTVSTFPWSEGFENGIPATFTLIDADNDGNNWTLGEAPSIRPHTGNACIYSASWLNSTALTPDNWMILPAFTLPDSVGEFNLTWYVRGQDPDYASENYSVYVSTTGRTVADFTTAALTSTATEDWVKMSVDLSSYAGQTIFIAFRHHNITDMFYLNIDDIRIGGPVPPEVTVSGITSVETNSPATFTATGANVFAWTVDTTVLADTGATISYTFTTTGTHMVIASATNVAGTGSDTLLVNVFSCDGAITAMPWNEDFEESVDCWHFVTVDATSTGFNINGSGYGHNDSDNCLFGSYSDDSDVDQWAVSPKIAIPADAQNYILKYYVYMSEWEGVMTNYEVRISTADTFDIANFTQILLAESGEGSYYVARTIQLGAYAGQTIRIAFHNITAQAGDAMLIDDIYIGQPLPPDIAIEGPEEVRTGEPYTFNALSDVNTFEWKVNGTVQSATGDVFEYTFPSAGVYTLIVSATNNAGTSSDTLSVTAVECPVQSLPFTPDLANDVNICWENEGWGTTQDEEGNTYLYSMSNLYGFMDLDPDNWIYTPALNMPASGSYEIAWKVMPYTTQLPTDHYGVYVVQNGNATLLFQETLNAGITSPSQRAVAIPATVSGDFKVALRHYDTQGGYVILVSDLKVVSAGSTQGIDNVNNINIAVYPNPANDVLHIDGEGIQQVEVIDVNGRIVISSLAAGSLNISSLSSGVYHVRVIAADGVSIQKIIKR